MRDPVIEAVVEKLRSRSAVGVKKYGTTLADNKASLREWLNHALEESMDHCNYLQRAIMELELNGSPDPITVKPVVGTIGHCRNSGDHKWIKTTLFGGEVERCVYCGTGRA